MAIYVTSDLHGYPFEEFMKFLEDSGFGEDDFLYVLGDVVDRGEFGARYLLWLKDQKNAQLILGNHEYMMLNCEFILEHIKNDTLHLLRGEQLNTLQHWMMNGCTPTVSTISRLYAVNPDTVTGIYDYLRSTPLYAEITVNDRKFLLVHGGLGSFSPEKKIDEYSAFDLVWSRPTILQRYYEDVTTIIGHTPTECFGNEYKHKILKTETWIDMDTSAAYGGHPSLLRLDDMQEFYIQ